MKKKNLIIYCLAIMAIMTQCTTDYVQPGIEAKKAEILTKGKLQFKDLNKNGAIDPYEDWRLPVDQRIDNLVSLMTLEEKVGLMFHPNIAVPANGVVKYDLTEEEKAALATANENYAGPIGPGGQQPAGGGMPAGQMRASATAKVFIEEKNFRNILNNGVAPISEFATWSRIITQVIFPNIRAAILSGAFLTLAIVIGEYTIATFLVGTKPFGPYLSLLGQNRAYEPAAVSLISFAITWAAMGMLAVLGRGRGSRIQLAGAR
jgi:hypothetical protein